MGTFAHEPFSLFLLWASGKDGRKNKKKASFCPTQFNDLLCSLCWSQLQFVNVAANTLTNLQTRYVHGLLLTSKSKWERGRRVRRNSRPHSRTATLSILQMTGNNVPQIIKSLQDLVGSPAHKVLHRRNVLGTLAMLCARRLGRVWEEVDDGFVL